jgi:eukaryotic-like serine/threonine-protein kinase
MPSALSSTFEVQKPIGSWSPVCAVDSDLAAPLWIGHAGEKVAYVRGFRTRGIRVLDRVRQVVGWASSYRDPGILRVQETLEVDGGAGLAVVSMYDEGEPLASIFTKAHLARKPASASVAASIALDVLEALHAMGGKLAPAWAHGSIRPDSILVGTGGRARVMEAGVVSTLAIADPLSQDPKWAAYAAPEQIRTGKPVGRSDVFTMGALLWELTANEPLFPARTFEELKRTMLQDPLERLKRQAPVAMPAPLMAVITQAIARRPEERFETPKAFAEAIESRCEVAEPYEVVAYLEELHGAALQTRRRQLETATGKPAPGSPPRPRRKKAMATPQPVEAPPPAEPPPLPVEDAGAVEVVEAELGPSDALDAAAEAGMDEAAPPEEPPVAPPPEELPEAPPVAPPPVVAATPAAQRDDRLPRLPGLYDDEPTEEPEVQRPTRVEGKAGKPAEEPAAPAPALAPSSEPEPERTAPSAPMPQKRAPAVSAGD